jgi:Zn-dependent M16 (insulinase) family peptidase
LGEVTGGLSSVRDATRLLEEAETNWPAVEKRLLDLKSKILRKKSNLIINLTGDKQTLDKAQQEIQTLLASLPINNEPNEDSFWKQWPSQSLSFMSRKKNEAFAVPSQVNYVIKGAAIFEPGELVSSSTTVVTRYLSLNYLWDNVRVVGGAYGGFARFSETTGRILFLSYRDPNLINTVKIYDDAGENLKQSEINDDIILQNIIGAIGDIGNYMYMYVTHCY